MLMVLPTVIYLRNANLFSLTMRDEYIDHDLSDPMWVLTRSPLPPGMQYSGRSGSAKVNTTKLST